MLVKALCVQAVRQLCSSGQIDLITMILYNIYISHASNFRDLTRIAK